MSCCLIIGCNGFIGSHLAEYLLQRGFSVHGMVHRNRERINFLQDRITIHECDILDKGQLENIISKVTPDIIFDLAAQSKVNVSWRDPEGTLDVNIKGTFNLLEAVRRIFFNPIIVVTTSAAIYGHCDESKTPLSEDAKFQPSSPYAISKVAQDLLVELYWRAYGLRTIRIRPFNITGLGMVGDACSDFAKGIAEIEKGKRKALNVGDLDSVRDITDISDAEEAFMTLAEKGTPGEAYNLCSGTGYRVCDLLSILIRMSKLTVNVVQDSDKKRTLVDQVQIGDNSKLRELGWKPETTIEKTLSDMLDYHRRIA